MNIFVTNHSPLACAQDHCDKHVVKMILETAQILSTVCHEKFPGTIGLYKPTHRNHPCVKWVMESDSNLNWLLELGFALCNEYTTRYRKFHKSFSTLCNISLIINRSWCFSKSTPFIIAAPIELRNYAEKYTVIDAYRVYIAASKRRFAKWDYCNAPHWWKSACLIADEQFPHIVNTKNDGVS